MVSCVLVTLNPRWSGGLSWSHSYSWHSAGIVTGSGVRVPVGAPQRAPDQQLAGQGLFWFRCHSLLIHDCNSKLEVSGLLGHIERRIVPAQAAAKLSVPGPMTCGAGWSRPLRRLGCHRPLHREFGRRHRPPGGVGVAVHRGSAPAVHLHRRTPISDLDGGRRAQHRTVDHHRTLHADMGGHVGVPEYAGDEADRFFTRHLRQGRSYRSRDRRL